MTLVFGQRTRELARVAGAAGFALGAAAVLASSCTIINQQHCAMPANEGACDPGLFCSVCASENNGCVAEPAAGCAYDGTDSDATTSVGPTTATSNTTGDTTTTSVSTDTTTLDPTDITTTSDPTTQGPTTSSFDCDPDSPANGDCAEPGAPYCVAPGVCGPCQDLEDRTCADIDAGTPACHDASGLCVECTPTDEEACDNPNAAVCNPYTLLCDECIEHAQCDSGACNLETGLCFPDVEDQIVYVRRRMNCAGEDGTKEKPFCFLQSALALADPFTELTIKLQHTSDDLPQNQTLSIAGPYRVAIVNAQDEGQPLPLIRTTDAMASALMVKGGAHVFLDGLRFDDNPQPTSPYLIQVDDSESRLHIDHSQLTNNTSLPWIANGELHINRSVMWRNGEGFLVTGKLHVRNSFISDNGVLNSNQGEPPGSNKYAPLTVNEAGSVDVSYTTIINNGSLFASVLECNSASDIDTSNVRNSVLIGKEPIEAKGLMMTACGSVIQDDSNITYPFAASIDNVPLDNAFELPMIGGVYRAKVAGELDGVAIWKSGADPYMDYDGDARPNLNNASDYAGADLP